MEENSHKVEESQLFRGKCKNCSGTLLYSPAKGKVLCEHCGTELDIDTSPATEIVENDFAEYMQNPNRISQVMSIRASAECSSCGAQLEFGENMAGMTCPFCDTSFVLKHDAHMRSWRPNYILPFKISRAQMTQRFDEWISKIWFLPFGFKKSFKIQIQSKAKGVYMPFWTFDADMTADFRATVMQGGAGSLQGAMQMGAQRPNQMSQSVSGRESVFMDDILVPASKSLPYDIAVTMTNWDRANYVPYREEFTFGYMQELYQEDCGACWPKAYNIMQNRMRATIVSRVSAGDTGRVEAMTAYPYNVKFKLVMLPIWLSAYRYKNKLYLFAVNGRTGQIAGRYPQSKFKKFLLYLMIGGLAFLLLCLGLSL